MLERTRTLSLLWLSAAALTLAACGTDNGGDEDDTGEADVGTDVSADTGGDDTGDSTDPCGPSTDHCAAFGTERPSRVSEHSAVYDETNRRMIVFGGTTAVPENCGFPVPEFIDELWMFDDRCSAWQQLSTTGGPSARARHMAVAGDGRMWVFGGRYRAGTSGAYTLFDELWSFDFTTETWTLEDTAGGPTARINGAMVWDSNRSVLWLIGGNDSASGAEYTPLNDVWMYDPSTGQWIDESATGGPSRRLFHTALYDIIRDEIVVFGGADESAFFDNAQYFSDIWVFDPAGGGWTELPPGPGPVPAGRFWGRMVHDTVQDLYVLFAGHDDQTLGNRNDSWEYDPADARWWLVTNGDEFNAPANGFCDFPADSTTVEPGTPERRNAHTMVWSETCGHALVFGGKTDCGAVDDVWEYDNATWTNRTVATEGEACLRFRSNPDNCVNMCF